MACLCETSALLTESVIISDLDSQNLSCQFFNFLTAAGKTALIETWTWADRCFGPLESVPGVSMMLLSLDATNRIAALPCH